MAVQQLPPPAGSGGGGGGSDAVTSVDGRIGEVVLADKYVGKGTVGQPGGVAPLDDSGLVSESHLPSVMGEPGPAGPEGPQGPKGDPGDPGQTGPAGPAGDPGPPGVDGAEGPEGPAGPAGPPGDTGPAGATGPAGPTGPAGADSTVPGPAGPKGDTGATGPQGPAGPPPVYRGDYNAATAYSTNDAVAYNGSLYVALVATTGTAPTVGVSSATWQLMARGLVPAGNWSSATAYQPGQVVHYQGHSWAARAASTNSAPTLANGNWMLMSRGFYNRGAYSGSNTYNINDVVTISGSSYAATSDGINNQPPGSGWTLLASVGNTGTAGTAGATGPAGPGVPAGGTTGQALVKKTNTDYDTQWITQPAAGLPTQGLSKWYADGRYYTPTPVHAFASATIGSTNPTGMRVFIPNTCTIGTLAITVTSASAGSAIELYIYGCNTDGTASTMQQSFTFSSATAGAITMGTNFTLNAGACWLWWRASTTASTFAGNNANARYRNAFTNVPSSGSDLLQGDARTFTGYAYGTTMPNDLTSLAGSMTTANVSMPTLFCYVSSAA